MMAPDLIEVIAHVQEQLGEQIDLLDREGGSYVRELAQTTLHPKCIQAPKAPPGMHPKVRDMVRSLVSDELFIRRHEHATGSEL